MKSAAMLRENNPADRITAIKLQKHNRRRYNVFIDGEYRFSVSSSIAPTLKTGEILTPSRIDSILEADRNEQAYEKALHYLKYRPRSRSEMARYLREKGFMETVVEAVLARLETLNYLDDEAFARFWIESRERHRPRGEFALRFELRAKGIPESIVNRLLSGHEELDSAWRAIAPKLRVWKTGDAFELKKKIHAFLSRRGFSFGTCEAVAQQATEEIGNPPTL